MLKDIKPRLYQEAILNTCAKQNTLVVLPTGLGKTAIAMLLAAHRLKLYPNSKILFLAPSKPLAAQHLDAFKKHLEINPDEMELFTGETKPEKREESWRKAKIIFSTPQGMSNDVIGSRISLEDVSCLIIDEAHKATGDYDYVWLAKNYHQKAKFERILCLTASPGANTDKILEVCKNCYIEEIEVRTKEDDDVKPYVQDVEIDYILIELPEELKAIKKFLDASLKSKIEKLKSFGLGSMQKTKGDLLQMQKDLHGRLARGEKDFALWSALSLLAESIKVQHTSELLESQGVSAAINFFKKVKEEGENGKSKATKNLLKDENFLAAYAKASALESESIEHPKIEELKRIVLEEIKNNKECKIIIFTQFRDSATRISHELNHNKEVDCNIFVGQTKKGDTGMSQKEQIALMQNFREGKFNTLVATSVAEEGIDIPSVNLVVFYEPVPSAIRLIQRRGRTGRLEKGKVIMLVTKNTIDETYRWAASRKEKKMYNSLKDIRTKLKNTTKKQPTLSDYSQEEGIKIFADTREQSSGVVKLLSDMNADVKMQSLITADYIISGRVGIERKSVSDFASSIIDRRLLIQLRELKNNFERPLIIIEGMEDIYSVRNIHPNAIRGMLATITVSYGIPIIYSRDAKDTAGLIMAIAKREQNDSGKNFNPHTEKKPLSAKELQEYIVQSLPNVGETLAKSLLKDFKSIKKIVNAEMEDLKRIEKIGEKKAEDIRKILDANYED